MDYIITRDTSKKKNDDELYHWKYIKKEKVHGKWRYYYDRSELDKYNKGVTEESKDTTGKYDSITMEYEKTNELFDGISTLTVTGFSYGGGNDYASKYITKNRENFLELKQKVKSAFTT